MHSTFVKNLREILHGVAILVSVLSRTPESALTASIDLLPVGTSGTSARAWAVDERLGLSFSLFAFVRRLLTAHASPVLGGIQSIVFEITIERQRRWIVSKSTLNPSRIALVPIGNTDRETNGKDPWARTIGSLLYFRIAHHLSDCCRASYLRLVTVSPRIPPKNAVRSQFSRITILRL